ncbi:hypothetical protein [Streptomyces sp. CAU 1734]|uniref:hypothetical protein n=1 Tax=Streptomyces sp. CAU 1734 TaxID=3140360 RepID=UPI0032603DAB
MNTPSFPTDVPHAAYAKAIMTALGNLADPDSWAEFSSDNGEVMLMEIVITIDPARAAAAGWHHGLILIWDQTMGWEWAYKTAQDGRNSEPRVLVYGPPVIDPVHIRDAVDMLLSSGGERIPTGKGPRQGLTATLTPALIKAMEDGDIDRQAALDLAVYATP